MKTQVHELERIGDPKTPCDEHSVKSRDLSRKIVAFSLLSKDKKRTSSQKSFRTVNCITCPTWIHKEAEDKAVTSKDQVHTQEHRTELEYTNHTSVELVSIEDYVRSKPLYYTGAPAGRGASPNRVLVQCNRPKFCRVLTSKLDAWWFTLLQRMASAQRHIVDYSLILLDRAI